MKDEKFWRGRDNKVLGIDKSMSSAMEAMMTVCVKT